MVPVTEGPLTECPLYITNLQKIFLLGLVMSLASTDLWKDDLYMKPVSKTW